MVIEELNKKLGSSTAMTKEREASIAVINKRLTGKDTKINKLALIF